MLDVEQPLLWSGLALGLASSWHCVGMCSGIAASIGFTTGKPASGSCGRLCLRGLLANSGRVAAYMFAGAMVGELGSTVFGAFDRGVFHMVLRWAAAVSL